MSDQPLVDQREAVIEIIRAVTLTPEAAEAVADAVLVVTEAEKQHAIQAALDDASARIEAKRVAAQEQADNGHHSMLSSSYFATKADAFAEALAAVSQGSEAS